MEKVITAEQISNWFTPTSPTSGSSKLIEDSAGRKNDGPSLKESPAKPLDEGHLNSTGGKGQKPEAAKSSTAPGLTRNKPPDLPITKNRQKLISLIESNSVVIVRGATGSGKTTQLPQYILDHHNENNSTCNIVVTQPRKIGATSIARWVATQRKCTLGSLVGYQVGLEKLATEHTRLIYMTTGVLLQKLVSAKRLTEFTHIFLDEVHERTEEMDFLLLVLRKLLHANSRYVKIILMSATINCNEFADYFATPVCGRMSPAYVFEVEGAPYAIEEFYLDDIHHLHSHNIKPPYPEDPVISPEMYNLAIRLIGNFDEMERENYRVSSTTEREAGRVSSERGSVLVFLPGIREIQHMQDALTKLAFKRFQVCSLHSSLTLEEQNGVFHPPVPGCRKVILSTNIAESSVTVPDVKYVIDFCLVRHLICDPDTNYQSLRLTWASKNNCNQRKGRAGRVSKGYCYRLVTKAFWENEIPDYMIPEMLLSPLASIMLKVKLLDMGDPRSLLSTALSPPNLRDIVKTVLQLKEMGALSAKSEDRNQSHDGDLTFLGRVLASLPVDLYLGKLIILGHVFGCLDDCLIIAASHSLKNFLAFPVMHQFEGYRSKMAFARNTPSDSVALLNAFKAWYTSKKNGQLRHPKDELKWGSENFVQIKIIREVAELYEELKKRVALFNMHTSEEDASMDSTKTHKQMFILQMVIAGAYYPNYFFQGDNDDHMASKALCGFNPRTTVMLWNLPPYSFLYYKQIQTLFRCCGQVKTIFFESSRVYVEFYRTSEVTGVLPEVFLALLMGVQGSPVELSVYPSQEIESCPHSGPITHMKFSRLKADIQSQSVSPLCTSLDTSKMPPSRFFAVNITEVVDVGHFWGFPADEASLKKQHLLTGEINKRTLNPVAVSLYPNLLCLAPYAENQQSFYYRAKILHLCGTNVEVIYLDFGNTAVVSSSSLRELPSDLLSQPFQAQEFQIAEMRPSASSLILGNQWSSSARNRFIVLVKDQSVVVSLYSILYDVMRVELFITSESTKTSVLDILVKEGHAVKAEESFDSQQSHETLMTLYKDMEKGAHVPMSGNNFWKRRKSEEEELINSLFDHFSKRPELPRMKVHLKGPSSSYKASFHSLSQKNRYRTVSLEKTSINSMAMNENPHHKHQRMLVAGLVSVNSIGTRVMLRHTTLLPDIPGLPGLVTMLFTPIMELRTNDERTCYSGALCGLGFNSQTQEAILPDNDIELAFDVRFDVEDLTEINALRVAINRLTSPLHLEPDKISQLQEDCQDRLTGLFMRSPPREAVSPLYYRNTGQWNQVDPSLNMDVTEPGGGNASRPLFQLHPVTLLNN
nr:ATP-dependent RNA helicase TDRD9 [Nothobranchius furzeri]